MEQRRLKAGCLFDKGESQAAVAKRLGVTRAAACQWSAAWRADRHHGLHSKGPSGAAPKLDDVQKGLLKRAILKGPAKAGYPTDFWTLERIRVLAKKTIRVDLGTTSVWRRVIELGFSVQKPERAGDSRLEAHNVSKIKKNGRIPTGFSSVLKTNPVFPRSQPSGGPGRSAATRPGYSRPVPGRT